MAVDLRGALRGAVGQRRTREPAGLDLTPASAFEAQTRQMVDDLRGELGELRGRVNWLLFLVAGAVVVDVVMRLTR